MRRLAHLLATLARRGLRATCGHHWHPIRPAYWSCCCCGEDHPGPARPVNHAGCIRPGWPAEPADPAVPALRDLEQQTGHRRTHPDPLTALRAMEQRTGRPPHHFGAQ